MKDYLAMGIIICISVLIILLTVKKAQVRKAVFAIILAQLFSWPISLLYVQFGWIDNPVRFFPHATSGNFLFAFIFHPSFFAAFYVNYPMQKRLAVRITYTALISVMPLFIQLLAEFFTNLIYFPNKLVFACSILFIFIIYHVSRIYIDWFFKKPFMNGGAGNET